MLSSAVTFPCNPVTNKSDGRRMKEQLTILGRFSYMLQFLYWLKALAAVLITNSHYAHIWPISSLAVGGQLGNCLFFFISGFTLYHIKAAFPKWYAKRIIRVYPALWMVNIIFFCWGDSLLIR